MNDSAIKNYATWARRELLESVRQRCEMFGIAESDVPAPDAQAVGGHVLTERERGQRAELLGDVSEDGLDRLVDKAAYTWFNRLVAIRFMEVNDRLPSHVRVLSSQDGGTRPQALDEAMDLPLDSLDADEVARLVQAGDDEALFRAIFLAQCDELADCMPGVFEHVGSAMELLLPDGLLRKEGLVDRLVSDIPEDDWREGVQIVGWMYQYYVSERKDEVFAGFKNGKKADRDAIAPATQLFTPDWIVRYLVENSLGRLWVLNHPESSLPQSMKYFVKPDEDHEKDFRHIESPEDIRVIDPACGSGHILVYAFDLLAQMYAEAGYSKRDAARLIVEKNLVGLEIDARAAELASFSITMEAMQLDGRFLRRGVTPNITVLNRVTFTPEELALCPRVAARKKLIDAAAHLDECGSLFRPSPEDLDAIAGDLAALADAATLFGDRAAKKLGRLQADFEPLAQGYDAVVTNPPYMGSSNMNGWVSKWTKGAYPRAKSDLCTCFFERGQSLADKCGYIGMITASSWMFISSFEKFRKALLATGSICSMIQQSTHGYAGVTVPTTIFVYACNRPGITGSYIRLTDFDRPQWQESRALEALANPECGWFFKTNVGKYRTIPGSPIAYWISKGMENAFLTFPSMNVLSCPLQGLSTADNSRFVRYWWEVETSCTFLNCKSHQEAADCGGKWFAFLKGGDYRRWYGDQLNVLNWQNDGEELKGFNKAILRNQDGYFAEGITWTKISSSKFCARFVPSGSIFSDAGPLIINKDESHLLTQLGFLNTTAAQYAFNILAPTLNYSNGDVAKIPVSTIAEPNIHNIVKGCVALSKLDWDSFELSWAFSHHPLI